MLKGPEFDIHEFLGGALPFFLSHYVDRCVPPNAPPPAHAPYAATRRFPNPNPNPHLPSAGRTTRRRRARP